MALIKFGKLVEKAHSIGDGIFTHTGFEFMTEYNNMYDSIDTMLLTLHGERTFPLYGNSENELYINFTKVWESYLRLNGYNFQRIYDAIHTEYNPLDNYDKNSTITTTYSGSETNSNTNTHIETESSNEVGSNTETLSSNEHVVTENTNNEDTTTTNNNGKQSTTSTESVTTYNDSDFEGKTKNKTDNDAYTNTENIESGSTENGETTTQTSLSKNNENDIESSRNATINDSGNTIKTFDNRVDEVTEHTRGNIGVTTSTKMLVDEIAERYKMDFFKEIFEKFIYTYSF